MDIDIFNRKKKRLKYTTNNVYTIIKSEIILISESLKKYKKEFLEEEEIDINNEYYKLSSFYNNLKLFPIYNDKKWDKLIILIPNIFNQKQIIDINKFYHNYKTICENSKYLNKKLTNPLIKIDGEPKKFVLPDYKKIEFDRKNFRNQLIEIIKESEKIIELIND